MLFVATNFDKVLIGRLFGKVPLGLYNQAFRLVLKPVQTLITPLTAVMFPTLSRAADPAQRTRLMLGFFRFIGLAMLPMGVGLAIVAPEAMRALAGPEWTDAGPILRILALVIPVQGCYNALAYVFAAAGRTGRLSVASVAGGIVLCAVYSLGLYLGWLAEMPLWGIALGYTIGLVLMVFPAYLAFALATVQVPIREWLAEFRPTAAATLFMAVLVIAAHWLLGTYLAWPDLPLVTIEISIGVASYIFAARRVILWYIREGLG